MNEERTNGTKSGAERSLSDLFARARKDPRNLLLTRERATEIIHSEETTVLHRLTWRTSLSRRLLSSPIRIGVTLMTTSAFASIMAIAISQFTGSAPTTPRTSQLSASITTKLPAQQHVETRVALSPAQAVTLVKEQFPSPSQVPVLFHAAATTTDSLNAIELGVDQLARLGISLPQNGDIVVYYPRSDSDARTFTFHSSGWMNGDRTPLKAVPVKVEPLPFAITYPRGEALLYGRWKQRADGTPDVLIGMEPAVAQRYAKEYAKRRGEDTNSSRAIGLTNRDQVSPRPGVIIQSKTSTVVQGSGASAVSALPELSATDSSSDHRMMIRVQKTVDLTPLDSTRAFITIPPKPLDGDASVIPSQENVAVSVERADSLASDIAVKVQRLIATDSLITRISSAGMQTPDSGMVRRVVSQMAVRLDSVVSSSLPRAHATLQVVARASNSNPVSSKTLEQYYRDGSGDTTSWQSLIPIRVTNYNTPEHHTLIFWYDRTPEVLNLLPQSVVEKADARPKNVEISVYPNPTKGEANVHYVVKNGQPISINVVSLLGHKLIEGGTRSDQHGDMTLNLSTLDTGVYLLIATLDNGEKAVERVVVTK